MSLALDAAYAVAAAATAPWWLRKRRGAWRERFGRTPALPAPDPARPRLLLHAVSVGETNLVRSLVDALAPSLDLVVASTTDTGAARARELFAGKAHLVRYPLDATAAVRRFLDAVRPDGVALVELELWPNFASECRRRGVTLAVVNGRLSDRSHRRYRLARPLLGRFFRGLEFVAAQDDAYAQRFIAAGADPARVVVTGSMKWDAAPAADPASVPGARELAAALGIDPSRPLVVAGSTAPDEHALLHAAAPPGAQLLCAPRKPEWFDQAARDLPGCVRRSANAPRPGADRFLLDTIGELRKAYALADLVVLGRSFGALFGSDPMEPAGLGKPLLIGPATADFRQAVDALRDAGALVVSSRDDLARDLRALLADPGRRARMAAAAHECVRRHAGATARNADLLRRMLRAPPPGAAP